MDNSRLSLHIAGLCKAAAKTVIKATTKAMAAITVSDQLVRQPSLRPLLQPSPRPSLRPSLRPLKWLWPLRLVLLSHHMQALTLTGVTVTQGIRNLLVLIVMRLYENPVSKNI